MTADNLKSDFDIILKGTIVPFFKKHGFKRKAQNFFRQTNDIAQCFNVQRSQWNSYHDDMSFTFNLGFYNQNIRNISWDKDDKIEFPKTTDCFIQDRLGTYSHKRDHWYVIKKTISLTQTAQQIQNDLDNFLLPLFEKYKSLNDLATLMNQNEKRFGFISPYSDIVYHMVTNQTNKGKALIKEHYKVAQTPQTITDTINFPDGTKKVKTSTFINKHYVAAIKRLADLYEVDLN